MSNQILNAQHSIEDTLWVEAFEKELENTRIAIQDMEDSIQARSAMIKSLNALYGWTTTTPKELS